MSVQTPIIPNPTDPKGIDSVVFDLQTHLNFSLAWLTNGLGRAYRMAKVEVNKSTFYLPQIYLGTAKSSYFAGTPDNDKQAQNFFYVGDGVLTDPQNVGYYGYMEYPISIIFSANLKLIDSTLLETEDFTEHLIADVRQALIRDLIGKPYRLRVDNIQREFDDVFSEFDITNNRGIDLLPLTHFRFNCTLLMREVCNESGLTRCAAILQNLTTDDLLNCILPTYDFSSVAVQDALTAQQIQDIQDAFCTPPTPVTQKSITLNGLNQNASTTYSAQHEIERTDLVTMDAWVKVPSGGAGGGGVLTKYDIIGIRRGWTFFVGNAGQLFFELRNDESLGNWFRAVSVPSITFDQWVHIAVTYSGTSNATGVKFYINGALVAATQPINNLTATTVDASNILRVGGFTSAPSYYNGKIYNPRMWKGVVMTDAEILQLAQPLASPTSEPTLLYPNFLKFGSYMGSLGNFGTSVWVFPDYSGIVTGVQTANVPFASVTTDVPL